MRTLLITTLTAASAALLVSGCQTTPEEQAPTAGTPSKPPAQVETKPVPRVDVTGKQQADKSGNPLKDPSSVLSRRSIYFDYDKFEVKDEFKPVVEAHAKYLRENRGAKMLIQGNADERGSREYNLGLGQRRSDNVKKMLTLLGAREDQIESVSLGEEKPVCSDHSEQCWAKNRRGDMLYNGAH